MHGVLGSTALFKTADYYLVSISQNQGNRPERHALASHATMMIAFTIPKLRVDCRLDYTKKFGHSVRLLITFCSGSGD